MAVERLTDYTRRIWTALAADAPEGHDIQVNDVIYYMDTSECGIVTYVYPEGSIDVEFLPDIGGGGGGDVEGHEIVILNRRTSSITAYYVTAVTDMPGLCATNAASIRANTTAAIDTAVQDGYFTLKFSAILSDVRYNEQSLPFVQSGSYNAAPYVGNDYPYELYFSN